MENNQFHFQQDSQNKQSQDYNPDQAYNYERAHEEPERGFNNHPIPPTKKKPNNLASASLTVSLAGIFLCCCSPYALILCSVMGITLAICSRFFNNDQKKMYPQAIAAIIISTLMLILVLGSIAITYILVPYMYETSPEFKASYDQVYQILFEAIEATKAAE